MRGQLPKKSDAQTGPFERGETHGTMVLELVRGERGWWLPVFFDHLCFGHLLEAEGCSAEELVGRECSYDGEAFYLH